MTDIMPMNQWQVTTADEFVSALSHTEIARLGDDTDAIDHTRAGVQLREFQPDIGFLCLRARADAMARLDSALQKTIDLSLPARLQRVHNENTRVPATGLVDAIRWISPDEWLLSAPASQLAEIEHALRKRVTRGIAIVNVSGNYAGLVLQGQAAREVLMKSTGYDVHPSNLPAGKVVSTTLAKAGVIVACLAQNRYEILVRRSYADYLWLWLQNAALEFRLDVGERILCGGDD